MTDSRKATFLLIAGSGGGILTMAVHPTSQSAQFAFIAGATHSLALVRVLLLFLGSWGITQVLQSSDRLAVAALVVYGWATFAITVAAAVSGFIVPSATHLMDLDVPSAAPQWRIAIAAIFQVNQAFSRIYSVAAAASILLWSICCLRLHRLSSGLAIYGCISAPVVAILICIGHLRLDIHGMTIVMASQVVWFMGIGVALWRSDDNPMWRGAD